MKQYLTERIGDADHELARLKDNMDALLQQIDELGHSATVWNAKKEAWMDMLAKIEKDETDLHQAT